MQDKLDAKEAIGASMTARTDVNEACHAEGTFTMECRDKDGNLLWREVFDNVVCTGGKNLALDTYLAGSSYTAVVYMGLIGATGYGAGPVAGDTMLSHPGWVEAASGVSTPRKTVAWSTASAGSKPATTTTFNITGTETIKGAFLVFGAGASPTVLNTGGVLYSAGTFSGGDQPVINTNTLNVTYSTSL
jgi:hypothetical protein